MVTPSISIRGRCCPRTDIRKACEVALPSKGSSPAICCWWRNRPRGIFSNPWLRRGVADCVKHAAGFVQIKLAGLPVIIRIELVRADNGFCSRDYLDTLRELRQRYIVAQPLRAPGAAAVPTRRRAQ